MQRIKAVPTMVVAAVVLTILPGCRSQDGELPAVFGAVFGAEGARSTPYRVGTIPERAVRPQDTVVGDAANNPGQCIFRNRAGQRFRASCPEGYQGGGSG